MLGDQWEGILSWSLDGSSTVSVLPRIRGDKQAGSIAMCPGTHQCKKSIPLTIRSHPLVLSYDATGIYVCSSTLAIAMVLGLAETWHHEDINLYTRVHQTDDDVVMGRLGYVKFLICTRAQRKRPTWKWRAPTSRCEALRNLNWPYVPPCQTAEYLGAQGLIDQRTPEERRELRTNLGL
jgi:hypothetical protein